jgi:hypothetical protein
MAMAEVGSRGCFARAMVDASKVFLMVRISFPMIPFRHRLKLRVINTAMLNPIMKNIN